MATEDSAGRIVPPKATARMTIAKQGGFWVATPAGTVPTLTQDEIDTAIDATRLRAAQKASAEG